jgi:hypothetical protein
MFATAKKLLGLLVLVLVAAAPLGCGGSDREPREERTTTVGGEHGVVVNRSDSGTNVNVGGEHGIVVRHPRDHTEDTQPNHDRQ